MQASTPISIVSVPQDEAVVNGPTPSPRSKYLVTWDFSRKPSGAFYTILDQEYGPQGPSSFEMIQKSVAICRDDFLAYHIAALAEHYGATVACYAVSRNGYDSEHKQEAQEAIERMLAQRLTRRGRRHQE